MTENASNPDGIAANSEDTATAGNPDKVTLSTADDTTTDKVTLSTRVNDLEQSLGELAVSVNQTANDVATLLSDIRSGHIFNVFGDLQHLRVDGTATLGELRAEVVKLREIVGGR